MYKYIKKRLVPRLIEYASVLALDNFILYYTIKKMSFTAHLIRF